MIRRRQGSDFLLITQDDHARFAGVLAGHFGNRQFAPPTPAEACIRAAACHDAGWFLHDDHPTINANQEPLDVFETPVPLAVKVWTESAMRGLAFDNYTALLVSMHVTTLSGYAASTEHSRRDDFLLNQFQQQEIERQTFLRNKLGLRTDIPLTFGLADEGVSMEEDWLAYNFTMLQIVDRISLGVCCTQVPIPKVENVRIRPTSAAMTMQIRQGVPGEVVVEPWPFSQNEIMAEIPVRRVAGRAYETDGELDAVYGVAPLEMMKVAVRRS